MLRSQVEVARDDLRTVERLLTSEEPFRNEHLSSEFRQEVGKRLRSYFRERHVDLDGILDDLEARQAARPVLGSIPVGANPDREDAA